MSRPEPNQTGGKPEAQVSAQRLLDLHQAAADLGVIYWTVRDFVQAGTIPTVKFPSARGGDGRAIRRILIDIHDLDAFISGNKERQN